MLLRAETVEQGSEALRRASDASMDTGRSTADTLKEKVWAVSKGTKEAGHAFEDSAAKVADKLKQTVGWASKDDGDDEKEL
jgi:hypothetical protein